MRRRAPPEQLEFSQLTREADVAQLDAWHRKIRSQFSAEGQQIFRVGGVWRFGWIAGFRRRTPYDGRFLGPLLPAQTEETFLGAIH